MFQNNLSAMLVMTIFISGCGYPHRKTNYPNLQPKMEISCHKEAKYFYINGVNTNDNEARDTTINLNRVFPHKNFELVYNDAQNSRIALAGMNISKTNSNKDYRPTDHAIKWFMDKFHDGLTKEYTYTANDLLGMENVVNQTKKNKFPIIIAHSYGNVFANKICQDSQYKVRTIHLANPTSKETKTKCEVANMSFKGDILLTGLNMFWKTREVNYLYDKSKGTDKVIPGVDWGYHSVKFFFSDPTTKSIITDKLKYTKSPKASSRFTIHTHDGDRLRSRNGICHKGECRNEWALDCSKVTTTPKYYTMAGSYDLALIDDGHNKTTIMADYTDFFRVVKVHKEPGSDSVIITPGSQMRAFIEIIKGIVVQFFK